MSSPQYISSLCIQHASISCQIFDFFPSIGQNDAVIMFLFASYTSLFASYSPYLISLYSEQTNCLSLKLVNCQSEHICPKVRIRFDINVSFLIYIIINIFFFFSKYWRKLTCANTNAAFIDFILHLIINLLILILRYLFEFRRNVFNLGLIINLHYIILEIQQFCLVKHGLIFDRVTQNYTKFMNLVTICFYRKNIF